MSNKWTIVDDLKVLVAQLELMGVQEQTEYAYERLEDLAAAYRPERLTMGGDNQKMDDKILAIWPNSKIIAVKHCKGALGISLTAANRYVRRLVMEKLT